MKFLFSILFTALSLFLIVSCKKETKEVPEPLYPSEKSTQKKAILEYKTKALLGEGAIWNHLTQELYWVDIEGKKLHIYNPSTRTDRYLNTPSRIGTVVPKDETHAVVALEDGVYIINTLDGELTLLSDIELDKTNNRFNDGKCDPSGRLWVGSMNFDGQTKSAALYMIDSSGKALKKLDSVAISNGIVWSKDKRTMYYIDTPLKNIRAFDYDDETGGINNERIAVVLQDSIGYPDGMAIDGNDHLWVGLWNGSSIGHFDPFSGKLIETIEVPAQNVTSCAFGGKNLDTLYITTASIDMTEENRKLYPHAGSIFKFAPESQGVESSFFK